jgi:hypothetical protein
VILAIKRSRKSLENIEKSSGSAIIELSKKNFRDNAYYQEIIDNLDINNNKSHGVTKEQTQNM